MTALVGIPTEKDLVTSAGDVEGLDTKINRLTDSQLRSTLDLDSLIYKGP